MLAIVVVVGGDASQAAEQAAPPQRGPTVLVDFRALDSGGQPVLDLKAADLILRAGGRERRVSSLELIRRGSTTTDFSVPPPFATNSAAQSVEGDVFVLIDEASIAPGREPLVREVLTGFLQPPADAGTVCSSSACDGEARRCRSRRGCATSKKHWLALPDTRHDPRPPTISSAEARQVSDILLSLFTNYSRSPIPTVVIVSGGFGSPPTGGVSSFGNYGRCPLLQNMDFENVGAAARAINASVYVVHLTDVTASLLSREVLERGVETLARALGAEVIRGAAPAAASMARIATETSAYYLAAFEAEANDRAGTSPPIELRARRPDVTIRARREIAAPQRAPSASGAVPTPDAMIRAATGYRDLPLRAAGFASRADTDGKVRLVVLFEPEDPAAKVTAASIGLYDA